MSIDNSFDERSFSYRIVSLLGQVLQAKNEKAESGSNSFPITVNSSGGIYYLQIVSAEFVESIPFIISTEP
ncbi:MAG: T9SS type A sorting domain-containing protein [Chitinophagaceae bacterium]|nr:T9SS type A sorting domain-containing protein [Chitinophagaceae bacterium]